MKSYMNMKVRLAGKAGHSDEWQRMVNQKALDIVNDLEKRHAKADNPYDLYKVMLNGARTYQEYADRYTDIHETPELAKQAMDRVATIAF